MNNKNETNYSYIREVPDYAKTTPLNQATGLNIGMWQMVNGFPINGDINAGYMFGGESYGFTGAEPTHQLVNADVIAKAINNGAAVDPNNLSTDAGAGKAVTSISIPKSEQPVKVSFPEDDICSITYKKTARDIIPWIASYLNSVFVDLDSVYIYGYDNLNNSAETTIGANLYFYISKEFKIPTDGEGKPVKTRCVSSIKMSNNIAEQLVQFGAMQNTLPYNITRAGLDVLADFLIGYDKKVPAAKQMPNYIRYCAVSPDIDKSGYMLCLTHVDVVKLLQAMIYESVEGDKITVGAASFQGFVTTDPLAAIVLFNVTKDKELDKLLYQKTGAVQQQNLRSFFSIPAGSNV